MIKKKKVLILANSDNGLYNFRKELIQELINPNMYLKGRKDISAEVYIALPYGKRVDELKELGCKFIDIPIERHGTNPVHELKLYHKYVTVLKKIRPNVVFTYTIKPNIYGGIACKKLNIPCIMNITGLGTAVENGGIMQKFMILLYRLAVPGAKKIFFQNSENERFFAENGLAEEKHSILPGSGVNLDKFVVSDYPSEEIIEFVFVSRIMKEKGIDQYLEAAKYIRNKYPNTIFHICGDCEAEYKGRLDQYVDEHIVIYHGRVNDMPSVYKKTHCIIHPTYYPEGMSNVLLEACASGRPIITTDRSGCREIVDNGVNGFIVEKKNSEDLVEKIERFLALSYKEKKAMGLAGRKKVEQQFDRKIVINKYVDEITCL